jgi:riboflavin kinase/FMN adenylyltransferase
VFDGVHRGHQHIIGRAVSRARDTDLPAVVITFDPHPSEVVRPGTHPARLTSMDRKAELLAGLGVDVMCVLPFTVEFSHLGPAEFVHQVLIEHLHAAAIVVGENFRFGHKAAGDVTTLRTLGKTFGFATEAVSIVSDDDTTFSSTYVRSCIDAGDVTAAADVLGRPHRLEGIVVRGAGRGRELLGYPTANMHTEPYAAMPADGVYAGYVSVGERRFLSTISIGTNPTFNGQDRTLEPFLLDFDEDLYGHTIAVEFVQRLRGQARYDGIEPLIEQMGKDVAQTRALLGR